MKSSRSRFLLAASLVVSFVIESYFGHGLGCSHVQPAICRAARIAHSLDSRQSRLSSQLDGQSLAKPLTFIHHHHNHQALNHRRDHIAILSAIVCLSTAFNSPSARPVVSALRPWSLLIRNVVSRPRWPKNHFTSR